MAVKMRMNWAPFAFILLVGLSWMTLWKLELPPGDHLAFLPPPKSSSRSRLSSPPHQRPTSARALRPNNLEIIRAVIPIDLEYVDVSNNHERHPHRGARDENGNWGYIHDETNLRRNPPSYNNSQLEQDCLVRDDNYTMLTQRVHVDTERHQNGKQPVKLFCAIYSTDAGHEQKIPAIRETWGQKCDGFLVGSNRTDASIDAVDIPHDGPESYRNMWKKVQSIWSYIYDYYYEKYDWFHIGGDDMYVLVENLRLYLESDEIRMAANGGTRLPIGNETTQTPLYLGRRFALDGKLSRIYNSGGPGYTLNKAALKLLVMSGFGEAADRETYAEDVFVGRAFQEKNVSAYDTKDDSGSERYMHFPPGLHVKETLEMKYSWYKKDSIDIQMGLNHSSSQSVAFHYISPELMRRMHAILYGMCDTS